jgi:hypothetical protein
MGADKTADDEAVAAVTQRQLKDGFGCTFPGLPCVTAARAHGREKRDDTLELTSSVNSKYTQSTSRPEFVS